MQTQTPTATPLLQTCVGDCDADGEVTIDEILRLVRIALELADVGACRSGDADGDGAVTIDEVIQAVARALEGCP